MIASRPPTRIESRRSRLTLEAPVEAPNAQGGAALAFQPVVTLWARLEAFAGREKQHGEQLQGVSDTRITIRYRAGMDARMRFTAPGRIFQIRTLFDPEGRKRDLVCLCEEISP